MSAVFTCAECGGLVSSSLSKCPHCLRDARPGMCCACRSFIKKSGLRNILDCVSKIESNFIPSAGRGDEHLKRLHPRYLCEACIKSIQTTPNLNRRLREAKQCPACGRPVSREIILSRGRCVQCGHSMSCTYSCAVCGAPIEEENAVPVTMLSEIYYSQMHDGCILKFRPGYGHAQCAPYAELLHREYQNLQSFDVVAVAFLKRGCLVLAAILCALIILALWLAK